jgi:hypothetical protein
LFSDFPYFFKSIDTSTKAPIRPEEIPADCGAVTAYRKNIDGFSGGLPYERETTEGRGNGSLKCLGEKTHIGPRFVILSAGYPQGIEKFHHVTYKPMISRVGISRESSRAAVRWTVAV